MEPFWSSDTEVINNPNEKSNRVKITKSVTFHEDIQKPELGQSSFRGNKSSRARKIIKSFDEKVNCIGSDMISYL